MTLRTGMGGVSYAELGLEVDDGVGRGAEGVHALLHRLDRLLRERLERRRLVRMFVREAEETMDRIARVRA